ncbi:MAG: alkane 1-monooxygenase [Gammaproteobacteria bacterium]|nr:alkane 1-monooxygenase [Gammaproteobacteria bacterium]
MGYYLRFTSLPIVILLVTLVILNAGDALLITGVIGIVVLFAGDALMGDDIEDANPQHTFFLNFLLYSHLPLLLLVSTAFMWQIAPGDWMGIGATLESMGWDVMSNHREFSLLDGIFAGGFIAGMIGAGGSLVGHELTHRTSDKVAMFFGRWLLAFSNDAAFSIEHVYGHHRHLGTDKDPATAKRGENLYSFLIRSSIFTYVSAWNIEKARLETKGDSVWGPKSRMMTGNLMSLSLFVCAYLIAGWLGVFAWLAMSVGAKLALEAVNYIDHYGIVRDGNTPVKPHHSWNSNKKFSSIWMYNLTRHSDHHARGEVPFWNLKAYPELLMMPYGYVGTLALSACPPLWRRVVHPLLLTWDNTYASADEVKLAKEANAASGCDILSQADSLPLYAA